jgi:hypothetical protein
MRHFYEKFIPKKILKTDLEKKVREKTHDGDAAEFLKNQKRSISSK